MIRLNIGGNGNLHLFEGVDYTCVDIEDNPGIKMNISEEPLPFGNNSVEAIYTSHTLEHVFPDTIDFILSEFYRVLEPEGRVRIVVPDMDLAIQAYISGDTEFLRRHRAPTIPDKAPKIPLYYLMSWWFSYVLEDNGDRNLAHMHGYTKSSMEIYLRRNSFIEIQNMECGMCSLEFEGCDFDFNKSHSFHLEARKI